ncbi:MAG: lysophospholipid acyltransferase family protein [Geminicoccaceae bacterium]|nr:1-acyl-sn-glycerol-3-phosphate acyltransferase [Geminicoccaceae bacterium]MCS7268515.1 1-acyl-sn-glycerol-3-phosphate acyltransferase [Geminicoccaceae bacterium]MDW8125699.1 lysophospholipid acyltransferase family protein [Geminicoccaceae bacterium]MDW8341889.1 lysophospholipid acyltransferase family protein [Geminicoccaceae bacterium]
MSASRLRAVSRLAGFGLLTSVLLACWFAALPLGAGPRRLLRRWWCKGVLFLLGVRLDVRGRPSPLLPVLLVPNHVSYLDVPILGALCDAVFVAKAEIADWPLFGLLARLARTMFVRRHWREAKRQRDALAARLARGESFVLFAEGTSSNGLDVLPLKTSLLSVAEPDVVDRLIAIQPVVLAYRQLLDGAPIDETNAELYAWYGEAALLPHLWRVLQLPGVEVAVRFGEPVPSWSVTSRKVLGSELRARLRAGLEAARLRPRAVLEPRPALA